MEILIMRNQDQDFFDSKHHMEITEHSSHNYDKSIFYEHLGNTLNTSLVPLLLPSWNIIQRMIINNNNNMLLWERRYNQLQLHNITLNIHVHCSWWIAAPFDKFKLHCEVVHIPQLLVKLVPNIILFILWTLHIKSIITAVVL